jgi:hypothetical protein
MIVRSRGHCPINGFKFDLGEKNMWASRPYLAFGRQNP